MRRGDFECAWRINDAHLRLRKAARPPATRSRTPTAGLPRHLQPIWDGTPLRGKRVLIRCYHGLGDTIQFIRYARLIRDQAIEVTAWVQPELIPLLRSVDGIDRLLPLHEGTPPAGWDVDVEVMELPYVFRSTLATIPRTPYLRANPAPLPSDERLAIGLFWRAGDWDERRSIPHAALKRLGAAPNTRFHLLHRARDLADGHPGFGIPSGPETIEELASTIAALDLCISVDSMPAHLAGALGVPVWTLLHSDPDWRWMSGEDCPWYPTMRLFRQKRPGDWDEVVERVAALLRSLSQKV